MNHGSTVIISRAARPSESATTTVINPGSVCAQHAVHSAEVSG